MDNQVITFIIQLVLLVVCFIVGRYVVPKIDPNTVTNATEKFNLIVGYADAFVAWARQFMNASTGKEKMNAVVDKLTEVADKYDIDIDTTQIKAIAQKSYDAMVAGEKSAETNDANTGEVALRLIVDSASDDIKPILAGIDLSDINNYPKAEVLPDADNAEKEFDPNT